MPDNVSYFGFNNEEIKGGLYEKFKGVKGEVNRLGIIYTDPNAMFAGLKIHYKDKYFICKKGKCCEVLGPAKWRVGSVIAVYGTDKQGNIKKPFSYELYPWVFSEQTYIKLKNVNGEFPLATHDIKVSCTNEDYQNLDIIACNECVWTAKEELKKVILESAKPIWENVKRTIASDLSVEDINDLLGITKVTAEDPTSKIDLESVLDKI